MDIIHPDSDERSCLSGLFDLVKSIWCAERVLCHRQNKKSPFSCD